MLFVYSWLLRYLPKPIVDVFAVAVYTLMILAVLAFSNTQSGEFIYWDQ